jgi:chromate reductase, NAD(P)H dehydrogenase (quinone)
VLSASPGALGGLRSQSHLVPLLFNLHCWICPRTFALARAGDAFNPQDELIHEQQQKGVQAVIDQVLWAARRLQPS